MAMNRKMMVLLALSLLVLAAVFSFLNRAKAGIQLHDDGELTKRELLKVIPRGTNIRQAQATMEENGFACSMSKNQIFAEAVNGGGNYKYHDGINFIYCDREDGRLLSRQRWQIALVQKDARVSEVLVSTSNTSF